MKIAISTESTADLTSQLIKENNIHIIGFHVLLGEKEYIDGQDINSQTLFDFVDKTGTLPKTSAISEYEYTQHFAKLLKSYDHIIHFCLSSDLSVSYQNAVKASKNFSGIEIINSKSLSTGIGLLVLNAAQRANAGQQFSQIVSKAKDELERVQASFVLDTLAYMHKGGRCSTIKLLGANLLKIKPEIKLDDGKMVVGKKYRGKLNDVLEKYVEDVLSENNPDKSRAFVTHSSYMQQADTIAQKLKQFGFEKVHITNAGATICSHCGPNTLGVLFINKKEN